jgi:hypothetical protein
MAPVIVVVEKIFLELIAFLIFCVFDLLHVTLFCEHHTINWRNKGILSVASSRVPDPTFRFAKFH